MAIAALCRTLRFVCSEGVAAVMSQTSQSARGHAATAAAALGWARTHSARPLGRPGAVTSSQDIDVSIACRGGSEDLVDCTILLSISVFAQYSA